MIESHRAFLSVLGIYLGGSWVVLQVVDVLKQNLGLPPWTFSLALTLLIIGLPIVLTTAWLQDRAQRFPRREANHRRTDADRTSDALTDLSSPGQLFTWRNALLGGLAAMALWGVFATTWLFRDRIAGGETSNGAFRSVPVDGRSGTLVVESSPGGVRVDARPVDPSADSSLGPAVRLGSTPLPGIALPIGETLLRLTGPDLAPLTLLVDVTANDTVSVDAELLPDSPITAGMVVVPEGPAPASVGGMPVETFLIDRHEVTNRAFAAFLADDGYGTPSLWSDSMIVEGERLDRSAALSRLVDRTGAPGPRTWSGAVFPAGAADHPVNGVSWYEARAYCSWEGRRLPSPPQWWRAALSSGDRPYPWGDEEALSSRANFEGAGTVPVESLPLGLSLFGVFEMAGNVREWLRPGNGEEAGTALSVGGSWLDPVYTFTPEWREELPLGFANETTGFRCVRHA